MAFRVAVIGACEWGNQIKGYPIARDYNVELTYNFTNEVLCIVFSQNVRNFSISGSRLRPYVVLPTVLHRYR